MRSAGPSSASSLCPKKRLRRLHLHVYPRTEAVGETSPPPLRPHCVEEETEAQGEESKDTLETGLA